ncbi:MAG: PKD domain-containing protein [Desulfamplus sp.]|nr:PKD domain-containing protein [Desulfamplus sp.]
MRKLNWNSFCKNTIVVIGVSCLALIFVGLGKNSAYSAPPTVIINTPSNPFYVSLGTSVIFSANITTTSPATISSYQWHSSIAGDLSTERTFSTSITPGDDTYLGPGTHIISLVATDSNGEKGYAQVTVVVGNNTLPVALITSPADNSSHAFGKPITFSGTGKDTLGVPLTGNSLKWESDIDGFLGTGSPLVINDLSIGTHIITLTATDSKSLTGIYKISITVGNAEPVALITSPANNSSHAVGKLITFSGTGTDAEDGNLTGNSLKWTSDKDGFLGTGSPLVLGNLSENIHNITLTAIDSSGEDGISTISVTVAKNSSPTATITAPPSDKSSYKTGETIIFEGTGTDAEDGNLTGSSLKWTSDKDGVIGTGGVFSTNSLSVNTHIITLTAADSQGLTDNKYITIVISNSTNNVPISTITAPSDKSSYKTGETIIFEGTGIDEKDGNLTGSSLKWTSDKDGEIGTGGVVSTNSLSVNTHIITLTAKDSQGLTDSKYITIVISNSTNSAPISTITAPPSDKREYKVGETIIFEGTGTDAEDGTLTGNSLKWTSDKDEEIGTGGVFSTNSLSVNTHIITLTATDSQGLTDSKYINITVVGASPVALITSPANNSSHSLGKDITFQGTGTDTEDGTLTGNSLKWTSSISGFLGYGTSLTLKNLAEGTHTITLTATDSKSLTGSANITIKVGNAAPATLITAPANNSSHRFGNSIEFKGTGTDTEDGTLTGNSLKWTSSISGFLGYGTSLTLNNLAEGTHTITFTANDKTGLQDSSQIIINIAVVAEPKVAILNPSDGAAFDINDYIEFKGEVSDNTDGAIQGDKLTWTSNIENPSQIGTGNILKLNTLSVGEHLITFTAENKYGVKGSDFISITIKKPSPIIGISSPKNGDVFDEGEKINFSGYADDALDGKLSALSLAWTSDIDGYIGNGANISKALSQGVHKISFTAKNSSGKTSTETIQITIRPTEQNQQLQLSIGDISIPLGQIGEVGISGGTPPYRYYKEYPHIASIDIIGNKISIVPEIIGKTTFRIVDHYNDTEILSVTVTDSLDNVARADAGSDKDVVEGTGVILDGSSSFQGNNGIVSWNWSQIVEDDNNKVLLSDYSSQNAMFVAPDIDLISSPSLKFRLTVVDKDGNRSSDDLFINISDNGIVGYPQDVITFHTSDHTNHLGAKISGDGDIVYINPIEPESIKDIVNKPENMLYGLVEFKIKVVQGGDANLIIYFPKPLGEEFTAYKYSQSKGWYSYAEHTIFSSDRTKAYLMLMDGSTGDDDGVPDGIISDPIAFGTKPKTQQPVTPEPSDDGGGGGGCFISTLFN